MPRLCQIRLLVVALAVGTALIPAPVHAQDDPNDVPLGDVARNLRKKTPARPVIDDDNLTQIMQQADSRHSFGASLRFLMAGEGNGFRVAAPDVTCSLSFSSNVKSLLSSQYSELDLPESDRARLEAHASVEGDTLTVSVHNATDWHVSEISVAFTTISSEASDTSVSTGNDKPEHGSSSETEIGLGRKPDNTVIYRMRAVGVPWSAANFSSRLSSQITPGEEWHWAIVQARGYPPESYRREVSSQTAEDGNRRRSNPPQVADPPAAPQGPEVTPVSSSEQDRHRLVPSLSPQ
jgi:hypothetical protein